MPQRDEAEERQRVGEVEPSKLPEPCTLARGACGGGHLMPTIVMPKAAPRALPEQAVFVLPEVPTAAP
eukprot:9258435-Alexandrium_andersonii.AAC.1